MELKVKDRHLKNMYLAVFFLSGFSGLIYESIWTHYLKLFLGHAAYAQALVLFIFMGGMSLGAWQAAKHGGRIRRLLVAYAVVELIVGLFSIAFHQVFVTTTEFVFTNVMASTDWVLTADLLRWALAALLIFPQSILLGATFPLMSGGIIRSFPESPGKTLSVLYFTNSMGAAIGVLLSGFVLIGSIGLPGTLFVAGVINLSLAMVVWLLSHNDTRQVLPVEAVGTSPHKTGARGLFHGMLLCSAITGMASFMYEIGWIRMLSMVLGSSTHAFELMLSAFILGLAIGGFWIRNRVDKFSDPVIALGWIQLVMGIMAVATLPVYGHSYEFMAYILKSIPRTDQGYLLFNLASHGIALAVMLPATICAGMTLPIITYVLFTGGHGEPAIGKVYSVNTLGGLIGIAVSVLFIMPVMGLKTLIIAGAVLDILLGLSLLWFGLSALKRNLWLGSAAVACSVLLTAVFLFHIDKDKMTSGVFRTGSVEKNDEILYHRDGRTSTVILARSGELITIFTNGKPDAALYMSGEPGSDEPNNVLAGALPMAVHPDARNVATIGVGSGLTSHVVLGNPQIEHVDTIEIEEAMVEGARGFGDRVERTFTDPRSRIYIEDAKAFFSSRKRTYDIIISEPSNPWVSGVSGLFSREFYHLVKRHIARDGLFVQWIHIYEIDIELVSSVIKALSSEFNDYAIYFSTNGDLLILAKKEGRVPAPSDSVFKLPRVSEDLLRIGVKSRADLMARYIGSKKTLDGLFATYDTLPNSDYFPVLDQGAVKTRFLNKDALELINIRTVPLPVLEVLEQDRFADPGRPEGVSRSFILSLNHQRAITILDHYKRNGNNEQSVDQKEIQNDLAVKLRMLSTIEDECTEKEIMSDWFPSLHWLMQSVLPYVHANELGPFWKYVESSKCYSRVPGEVLTWIKFYKAVDERDYPGMVSLSEKLLSSNTKQSRKKIDYLVASALLGSLAIGDSEHGASVLRRYGDKTSPLLLLRLLASHVYMAKNKN